MGRQGEQGTYKDGDTRRQDTRPPTDLYQAGTKQGDFQQAGTKQGVKDDDEDATDSRPEVIVADTGGNRPQRTRAPIDIYQAGTETRVKKPGRGRGRL